MPADRAAVASAVIGDECRQRVGEKQCRRQVQRVERPEKRVADVAGKILYGPVNGTRSRSPTMPRASATASALTLRAARNTSTRPSFAGCD